MGKGAGDAGRFLSLRAYFQTKASAARFDEPIGEKSVACAAVDSVEVCDCRNEMTLKIVAKVFAPRNDEEAGKAGADDAEFRKAKRFGGSDE